MARSQQSLVDAWLLSSEIDHRIESQQRNQDLPDYAKTDKFRDFLEKV